MPTKAELEKRLENQKRLSDEKVEEIRRLDKELRIKAEQLDCVNGEILHSRNEVIEILKDIAFGLITGKDTRPGRLFEHIEAGRVSKAVSIEERRRLYEDYRTRYCVGGNRPRL